MSGSRRAGAMGDRSATGNRPGDQPTGSAAIDAYLSTLPPPVAARVAELRALVQRVVPEAVETMSYGIPTFDLWRRHLVHVAGFSRHVGFYPGSSGITAFAAELAGAGYRTSRGTLQLPHDRPLPTDLVERIVRFRVAEERARAADQAGRARRGRTGGASLGEPGATANAPRGSGGRRLSS